MPIARQAVFMPLPIAVKPFFNATPKSAKVFFLTENHRTANPPIPASSTEPITVPAIAPPETKRNRKHSEERKGAKTQNLADERRITGRFAKRFSGERPVSLGFELTFLSEFK